MVRDHPPPPPAKDGWMPNPWALLLGGLTLTLLGLLSSYTEWTSVSLLLVTAGLLVGGFAVSRQLQTTGWEMEDRVETAAFLALSGFLALLSYGVMAEDWDSGKMFFAALLGVALAGAVLVLLPTTTRKVVLVLLVVFHFGGMLTAVTSVAPPNAPAPWVSNQLWRMYRPYLTMTYLTNAYHFYSPDPGPATLVWFRVEYADGTYRWVRVPDREASPVRMHYQRMLALTESTNNFMPRLPLSNIERELLVRSGHPAPGYTWEEILERRRNGATFARPEELPQPRDLLILNLPVNLQYREPQELAKRLISSYARYVAHHTPHSEDPDIPVKSVKVYRVLHNLMTPAEMAAGKDPYLQTRYLPYFQGEFDPEGRLLNPADPFLYWYVPMVVVHKDWPDRRAILPVLEPPPYGRILDGLAIHSGDKTVVPAEEQKLQ
jgi:hypothetical protein